MAVVLRRILTCHWFVTLLFMGLFGAAFSLTLANLITLLRANLRLIARYGQHVLFEGALQQLAELVLLGYVAVIAYVLFKVCECALVQRIMREPDQKKSQLIENAPEPLLDTLGPRLDSDSQPSISAAKP